MYLLWFCICVIILKENLAAGEVTSIDNDQLYMYEEFYKRLDLGYKLVRYTNLTGTMLRAKCQLKNREWGSKVMINYQIQEPQKSPEQITSMCVFNTTFIGEYICSLRMDVSKLAHDTKIYCYTYYEMRGSQVQSIIIFEKKNLNSAMNSSESSPVVRPWKPLIDCQNKTGYEELAWDLDTKKVRLNATVQNITLYKPGEFKAICVLACFTKISTSKVWNITWTLDGIIIMNELVKSPYVFKLPLHINLTDENNGKALKCSLISEEVYVSRVHVKMLETNLLLPGDYREHSLLEEQASAAQEESDLDTSSATVVAATAVGTIVCLGLLVAAIFFCRKRRGIASIPTGNDSVKNEPVYSELNIHGVVYADLVLPQQNGDFKRPPKTEYAEILGVITDN